MNDEFQKAIERVVDGNETPASRNAEDAAVQAAAAAVVGYATSIGGSPLGQSRSLPG